MTTFLEYTYVPTRPRPKRTSKQSSIRKELPHSRLSETAISMPQTAAANDIAGSRIGVQGTSTVFEGDDDDEFPSIEQLLGSTLQREGFAAEDQRLNKAALKFGDTVVGERGDIDDFGSATSDSSSGSLEPPIVLADDDSSASEAEFDKVAENGGLLPDSNIDSTTPNPQSHPDVWHDIDDHLEIAQNSEQASTSNPMRPHTSPPYLSELLGDHTRSERQGQGQEPDDEGFYNDNDDNKDHRRQRPQGVGGDAAVAAILGKGDETSMSGETDTGQGLANTDTYPESNQDKLGSHNDNHSNGESHKPKSDDEDRQPRQAKRKPIRPCSPDKRHFKPHRRSWSETSAHRQHDASVENQFGQEQDSNVHGNATEDLEPVVRSVLDLSYATEGHGYHQYQGQDDINGGAGSEDEFTNHKYDSGNDFRGPQSTKRKRVSSCQNSMAKKRRHYSQQDSRHERALHSSSRQPCSKSQRLDEPSSRLTAASGAVAQLPSPAASMSADFNPQLTYDCRSIDGFTGDEQPTLAEITLRLHSSHRCSFSAVIREGYDSQGLSFSQATRLIENIGIIGQIDDFTIKPLQQHLFLLNGFSRRIRSQLSHDGEPAETSLYLSRTPGIFTSVQDPDGRRADFMATASETLESSSSDDNGSGSESDVNDGSLDLSSDDDGDLSDAGQGVLSTTNRKWSDLDEERLKAYKKEDKDWRWIFRRFPRRTENAVRMRWSIIQRREASRL